MDRDFSYLAGLICSRGRFLSDGNKLIIDFPYKAGLVKGINKEYEQKIWISYGLFKIKEIIDNCLGIPSKLSNQDSEINLIYNFHYNSLAYRKLRKVFEDRDSYYNFDVPKYLYEKDTSLDSVKYFIRGFCDIAGTVRKSNNDIQGRHRVYIDVINSKHNWDVPVQLCYLLQKKLAVPIANITWGHPDLGRKFREHLIRVYAEDFKKIGFEFEHKNQILIELSEYNEKNFKKILKKYCPGYGRENKKNPTNKNDDETKLPKELLNNNFNTYWKICQACGCEVQFNHDLKRVVIETD